ncbi:hydrogenase nickel incorporation protein HypA [Saccharopolyspora subtropica]|uniref:Hydrogenase maturation factor HypA n=1 Tax=Saccharopolyspora thermophila TaxID=89367 RepID=A0A917JUC6_9PSEU|nr:hydrogenase maturation nickel metallochaperone HypA [Saccharopolyspora subtropica]GGI86977.1 hydrogenase nickel incorporation protein HypA [Saccharopolyspora subtropica]
MHELGITQCIVDAVVSATGEAPVRRVHLEVGVLSGVVPHAVRFCFDLVARGTPLEGAELAIAEPAGRGKCRSCGAEFAIDDLLARCRCGSTDVAVVAGEQVLVKSVEVV